MVDYRKFLAKSESLVLPYLGGLKVHAPDRPLTLVGDRPAFGWWRFDVKGRNATAVEAAEPPDLDDLPRIRGHFVDGWLFTSGAKAEFVFLAPDDVPPRLSIVTARRWHDGTPLFDTLEFDNEAENAARLALEEGEALGELKGVAPSLRVAFGYARLRRATDLHVSPFEALPALPGLADGSVEVNTWIAELHARRFHVPEELRHRPPPRPREEPTEWNAEVRAAEVLSNAGATYLGSRFTGGDLMEVTFRFRGERFISVVDWRTLHVYDSGICLSGADELLGLDALPAVIDEAIREDALNITRH